MIVRTLRSLHRTPHTGLLLGAILLLPLYPAHAQSALARRIDRVLDTPPYDRATWGVMVMDSAGKVLYQRNADRLFAPASNTKLVVAATATALLPPDFTARTSFFGAGSLDSGVLRGDLVAYGRGDPTFDKRCYNVDTLAFGACDERWGRMDALAESLSARGLRHVTGAIVGDGSYF